MLLLWSAVLHGLVNNPAKVYVYGRTLSTRIKLQCQKFKSNFISLLAIDLPYERLLFKLFSYVLEQNACILTDKYF